MNYRTIAAAGEDAFVERKSRFIGRIRPVSSEQEAQAFIAAIKKECWDATHNVWAYVLRDGGIRRYSDDGEPQGTAGVPMLEVLLKNELTDCVVVVTRYFGGVLLGAGGLVRAYSQGAAMAVKAGGVVEMRRCVQGSITCDYGQYGYVSPLIVAQGGVMDDTVFTEAVTLNFHLPQEQWGLLTAALTERSAGTLTASEIGEAFYPFAV